MPKQSTVMKQNTTTSLKTTGVLLDHLQIETEDLGILDLEQLLGVFNGKLITIQVRETQEEELDIV